MVILRHAVNCLRPTPFTVWEKLMLLRKLNFDIFFPFFIFMINEYAKELNLTYLLFFYQLEIKMMRVMATIEKGFTYPLSTMRTKMMNTIQNKLILTTYPISQQRVV